MRKGKMKMLYCFISIFNFTRVSQNAMKHHNINLEDAEHFQLGSDKEKQAPPKK